MWEVNKNVLPHHRLNLYLIDGFKSEHSWWNPKDGELFLLRVKPGETLVKARSDTDVQIVRPKWV